MRRLWTNPFLSLAPELCKQVLSPSMSRWVSQEEHRLHVDLSVESREAHARDVVEYRKKDSSLGDQAYGVVSLDRRKPGRLTLKPFAGSDHADIPAGGRLFPHDRHGRFEQLFGQDPDPLVHDSQVPLLGRSNIIHSRHERAAVQRAE